MAAAWTSEYDIHLYGAPVYGFKGKILQQIASGLDEAGSICTGRLFNKQCLLLKGQN